ncbi:MAG: hypothetical protein ACTHMQ_08040 [Protaetiibacter sp.]
MNAQTTHLRAVAGEVDMGLLGLGSVLVGSLPTALLTSDAPERYSVEAVFTRKPEREEIDAILSNDTRAYLSQCGYSTVELSVSDRRLVIANTNLEELRDGLAGVLGQRLSQISIDVQARRVVAAARIQKVTELERQRAASVVALAGSVSFAPSTPADDATGESDRSQLSDWIGEGGSSRG